MPGSWDYRIRVREPASSYLVGFLFASGVGPLLAGTGALLFNSGQYNRSVLISQFALHARGHGCGATGRTEHMSWGISNQRF